MSKKNEPPPPPKNLSTLFIFVNGGLSGMLATCVVHPTDVVKNRMQMSQGVSIKDTVSSIWKDEGFLKFYRGLSAGLVRQASYTTVRLGTYNKLQEIYKRSNDDKKPSYGILAVMAATAGGTGAFFGTPADVALVRMSSDGRLPPDQRRNYKNVFDAFIRISKEEGIKTLWKGVLPTMGRAVIVNTSQLATYTQSKSMIANRLHLQDGFQLYLYSAMISGFVTTFNSMPFDIAKTRIQNLPTSKEKTPGLVKVIVDISKKEGVPSLWRGFIPNYCRVGPHTVLTFLFNEEITKLYRKYVQN